MSHLTTITLPLSRSRLRGVVFDMDGTLTVPVIDFQAMYKAVLGEEKYTELKSRSKTGIDILGIIEEWSEVEKRRAYEVIADFEREGLERLQIMPGFIKDIKQLAQFHIATSIKGICNLGATFDDSMSCCLAISELDDKLKKAN